MMGRRSLLTDVLSFIHFIVNGVMDFLVSIGAPDLIMAGIFYLMAAVTVLSALGVVLMRNVVHSALMLTASFIGVGCLYIYMNASFMGAVQFLVYGGAVAVLIVMAIMLTRRPDMAHSNPSRGALHQLGAAIVAAVFCLVMLIVSMASPFRTEASHLGDEVKGIADLMLTEYVLPFEVAAVLLLIAMIGAIILAKVVSENDA